MDEYVREFVQESEENITELNNALLALERDPDDDEAMERIFRTAHTLKGNCGAMGFTDASDLAHALEDLLDAVRSGDLDVSPELMDRIFEGVDALESMIEEVPRHGEPRTDPTGTIETLREELAAAEGLTEPSDREIDALIEDADVPADVSHNLFHVRLDVSEELESQGMLVVEALEDAFELLGTAPNPDEIEAGDYGGSFDAVFASAVGERSISAALDPVDAVVDAIITEVTERVGPDEPSSAEPVEGSADDEEADDVDPDDMEVDDLLDEFSEYDDLDEMVEQVDDVEGFEDLGDAGTFDDIEVGDVDAPAPEEVEAAAGDSADEAAGDADAEADSADDEDGDASDTFQELKQEVDPVGFDELQNELEELEFEELDDDEVGFDELLDEDELAGDDPFASGEVSADPFGAGDGDEPSVDELIGDEGLDDEPADEDADADDEPSVDELIGDDAPEDEDVSADDSFADDSGADDASVEDALGDVLDGAFDAGSDDAVSETETSEVSSETSAASASEDADEKSSSTSPSEAREDADAPQADDSDHDASTDGVFDDLSFGDGATDETASADERSSSTPDSDAQPDPIDDVAAGDGVTAGDDATVDADAGVAADDAGTADADADVAADADADVAVDEGITADDGVTADDDGIATDDDGVAADDGPDLDLDNPFEEPSGDDAASEPSAAESADADDGDAEISEAGQFEDLDFTDPDAPDEGEQFGTADELDLSMGVEDDEADDEAAETEVETTSFDTDSISPDEATEAPETGGSDSATSGFGDADAAASEADANEEAPSSPDAGSSSSASEGADPAKSESGTTDSEPASAPTADAADAEAADAATADADEQASAPSAAAGTGVSSDEIQSIRVDVDRVDDLMNLVEELVTTRARLRRAVEGSEPRTVIEGEVDELEAITSELQDTVMDVRLVPLKTVANKLPRLVRDISREQDKRVTLEMDGEDVELDRSILNEIGDPLMHLVRNAIDHGIESPEEREDAGKDPEGTIELRAHRERDEVVIEIDDDGRGLDVDAIRDEAVEQGIAEYEELLEMDDEGVYDLVFHSGFSTSEEVTDVSGRGVGMDVVARTVEELDGSVSVDSEDGEGTTVTLRVPISVAIADVLFVESGGEEYGIPIKVVEEIGPSGAVDTEDGREVISRGEESYPLVRLSDALETPQPGRNGDGMMVKVRDDVRPVALHCDRIRGQQEVVVKPFEGFLGDIPGLSGATVLGEGDVVNILDVETL